MGFMDNPLYAGLVAGLEKKYRQREERVRALLASGDREALTHRAEDVRQRLCRSLTDADLLRTLGDARALPAGSLCLDGYAVENILLVFRHGYCVPVNVYVPRCGAGKHPALVVSIGHWSDGKTIRENQIFCANLARNGILAAAYDPLFQGERCPYDREALAELFGGLPEDMLSVSMHMQAGNLAYLLGRNVAALFAHDSVAVLDYLCTRPDVDTGRIGCTGQSGGGTQSLYLSALDDRIRYCSPIQCVSRQRLINPTGIGDCEQSLLSISAQEGFDQADLLWSSFPKPLFLNGALYDSFPIVGARETAAELAELYDVMGLRERFTARFASCAHEISAETRRFAYEWFVREMLEREALPEVETPVLDVELRCAERRDCGRPQAVYASLLRQGKPIRPTGRALRAALRAALPAAPAPVPASDGFSIGAAGRTTQCVFQTGRVGDVLRVRVMERIEGGAPAGVLTVAPFGMMGATVKRVPAYDGETAVGNAALVLGENLTAERVAHILCAVDTARRMTGCVAARIEGEGLCALLALLAACAGEDIAPGLLTGMPDSLETLTAQDPYLFPESMIWPGLLALTDIPDLCALCGAHPDDDKERVTWKR